MLNNKRPSIIEHLAFLSVKYKVFIAELFTSLVAARETGQSICEQLTVEYRGSVKNQAIFLITQNSQVVVQFRVEETFLKTKDFVFESWLNTDKIRRQIAKQAPSINNRPISDLRHGMKKVNVEGHILESSAPFLLHTRYGNSIMLTNAWIADDTGKIRLCLWGDQANSAVVGQTIQIKNASVFTYKGERQLRVGKNGTIKFNIEEADKEKLPALIPD
jgi:replication factor A1